MQGANAPRRLAASPPTRLPRGAMACAIRAALVALWRSHTRDFLKEHHNRETLYLLSFIGVVCRINAYIDIFLSCVLKIQR